MISRFCNEQIYEKECGYATGDITVVMRDGVRVLENVCRLPIESDLVLKLSITNSATRHNNINISYSAVLAAILSIILLTNRKF